MTSLLIGCPVTNRAWVLSTWFEYVRVACEQADLCPEFIFVCPRWDTETQDLVLAQDADVLLTDEPTPPKARNWAPPRLHHMVTLRNQLLAQACRQRPEFFWSLDSDILPAPNALVEVLSVYYSHPDAGAVGMHLYMSSVGREHPSKAMLGGNAMVFRPVTETELHGSQKVDVLMGSILMTPQAYHVEYEYHSQGEDVGWAQACARAGVRFRWAADAMCKHIMTPAQLERVDPRLGW